MVITVKLFLLISYMLFLIFIGSYCIFFPKNVQSFAIKAIEYGVTAKSPILKTYIQSDKYLINVRFIGVVAYIMFGLLAFMLYKENS